MSDPELSPAELAEPSDSPTPAEQQSELSPSRRVFVQHLTFLGGGVVLLGCDDAKTGGGKPEKPTATRPTAQKAAPVTSSHRTFTDVEWATLTAAVDRILPKDEDPGALDANVPEYIDRMLQSKELTKMRTDFVPGLAALDRRAQRMFKTPFAQCTDAQKDELLGIFKDSPEKSGESKWYEILLVLCLEGFLGDPSYGGNKDQVGWKLAGFELVGHEAPAPKPGYDGEKLLQHTHCGGKGC